MKVKNDEDVASQGEAQKRQSQAVKHACRRWILFVTGPTASGKTSIAKYLAERLDSKFLEGDDFHPNSNVEKMSHGEPLTDADRWGWLQAIAEHAWVHPTGPGSHNLIVTCSALKREYRDILREGSRHVADVHVRLLFLDAPADVLSERAEDRKGHFAGSELVPTQMEALERPGKDEEDVLVVDSDQPIEEVEGKALSLVRRIMSEKIVEY